jgi:hypothetical protein
MAIRTVRHIPDELPHARLYLDDIEEISAILRDAFAPTATKLGIESKVIYKIGDIRMDSIDDLQTRGGSTKELEVSTGGLGPSVRFGSFLNPEVQLHIVDDEEAWAIYGKIRSIFEPRQLRVKNAIAALPEWLKWFVWPFLPFSLVLTPYSHREVYFIVGYVLVTAIIGYVSVRPSRVVLVRYHERRKKASEERAAQIEKLIFLLVGAVIGAAVNYFFRRLSAK